MTELDALFFAAHPDDAELCCGGTIASLVKAGKRIGIIDITKGELGTRGSVLLRKIEAKNATKILGMKIRENLGIPDGCIKNSPANRLKVINAIRKYRPKVVFFPHYNDRHPDHYNAHILVKEAVFYSGLSKIQTKGLTAYRPKRNINYMQTYTFEPNIIMDISETYQIKMNAIKCYSSQFFNEDIPEKPAPETFISTAVFMEFIEARAKFYGFKIGVKYGEAFYTEEKIKLTSHILLEI